MIWRLLIILAIAWPVQSQTIIQGPTRHPLNASIAEPLLLWYKFNEGSGASLTDSSGNGNTGSATGITWITGKSGSGNALQFNGTSSHAETPSVAWGTNRLTVCAWVYWNSFSTADNVLFELSSNFNSFSNTFFTSPDDTAGVYGSIHGTTGNRTETYSQWTAATWTHVAILIDNSTTAGDVKLWLNGVESSSSISQNNKSGSGNLKTDIIYIFSRAGASLFGAGRLDDFRVYAGELTLTEITTVMNDPQ